MDWKYYQMVVIQTLWNLKEEDCKFQASLNYIVRPYLKSTCKYPFT